MTRSPPPHVPGNLLEGSRHQSIARVAHTLVECANLELPRLDEGRNIELAICGHRRASLDGYCPRILGFLSLTGL